jgi:hypothetical protein
VKVAQPLACVVQPEILVYDIPLKPYQFEAFYVVAQEEHARMLAQLANQEHLYLTFCSEDGNHHFTQLVPHDEQQWQHLDDLTAQASAYLRSFPENHKN